MWSGSSAPGARKARARRGRPCIGAHFFDTYTTIHRCGSVVLSGCTCIWADLSWQTIKRVFSLGTASQILRWRWVFVRHFQVNCYSRPYIHSVRKAISPYLPLQARGCGAGDSMMWLMCLQLNFVRLSRFAYATFTWPKLAYGVFTQNSNGDSLNIIRPYNH